MTIEVEGMLRDDDWCKEVWRFVDHADAYYPDVKWRDTTLAEMELAVELTLSLLVRLERSIESRVQIAKKNHWAWNFTTINFMRNRIATTRGQC